MVRAYTVPEFLRIYRVSRTALYQLWRDGKGPASYKVRGRRLISIEAAERWVSELEFAERSANAPWSKEATQCLAAA